MRISIFAKNHDEVYQIEEAVKIEAFKRDIIIDDKNPDVIIYIGGDGTFLNAVQNNLDRLDSIIFLGINTGCLGYFYNFNQDDIEEMFALLQGGCLKRLRINLMKCDAKSRLESFTFFALNEVRMISSFESLKCEVKINDEVLENFAGNELVISSSSGSTGLNKSIGGAIIDPNISTFQLTPIAPINNSVYNVITNPIIFYNDVEITLTSKKDVNVAFDYVSLDEPIRVLTISRSDLYVSVFFRPDTTFIGKLKESFIK